MNTNTQNPSDSTKTEDSPNAKKTILSTCMLFRPGQILATPGSLALMKKHGVSPLQLLTLHVHGDWGDCCLDDAAINQQALSDGSRLMSVRRLVSQDVLDTTAPKERVNLPTIWIISDATTSERDDPRVRHVTTFLCPSEY
jgi:hypothetical protein